MINQGNSNSQLNANTSKSASLNNKPAILMLLLLLLSWGYFLWDKKQNQEIIAGKDNQLGTAFGERDALKLELDAASIRYNELKKENTSKDSAINVRDKEIAAKKQQIKSLLNKANLSKSELNEAKAMIASLNDDIEIYKQTIAQLQQEKAKLTSDNEQLSKEKNDIQTQLNDANQQNNEKDAKLDIASTLNASSFNIMALDEKKNGSVKETTKAKNADKLRIQFNLDANRVTNSGVKILFIVISDPNGNVLSSEEYNTVFQDREGKQIKYTQKMDINYEQNKPQTLQFDWKGVGGFQPGNYRIDVYHNGFNIGSGNCPLRKPGFLG
jgi:hypothetical protein